VFVRREVRESSDTQNLKKAKKKIHSCREKYAGGLAHMKPNMKWLKPFHASIV
jgi:hypothetical protein